MKLKKVLKWTGIVAISGLGGALIASPELRDWAIDMAKEGFNATKGIFGGGTEKKPAEKPVREGRNSGGYYKPRYNNKKQS